MQRKISANLCEYLRDKKSLSLDDVFKSHAEIKETHRKLCDAKDISANLCVTKKEGTVRLLPQSDTFHEVLDTFFIAYAEKKALLCSVNSRKQKHSVFKT